ncbi:MAG: hypothetical protein EA400_12290 [Chromatiaceae bacterium]|nr:MAG: hypothetical protein EA400_12290 [Chromatiaceae bacterium]
MAADRAPPARPGGQGADADLTLQGPSGSVPTAPFPNPSDGPRLVLYQREDGALDLRWRLDPVLLAQARAAFGPQRQPTVRLLLRRPRGEDDARTLAAATLAEAALHGPGLAHWSDVDSSGPLLAEIGLTDPHGGWLLVARSNQLEAVGPVGVATLRRSARAPVVDPVKSPPPVAAVPPVAPASTATPPRPARALAPHPATRTTPASTDAPAQPPATAVASRSAGAPALLPAATTDSGAVRWEQETAIALLATAPAPAGVAPAVAVPQPAAPTETPPATPAPRGGSGPIRGHRDRGGIDLHAELLVHGRAAPGTLLDLGGHPYRVGAGGHFMLRVPIADLALVRAALARLPALPVAARQDEPDGRGG